MGTSSRGAPHAACQPRPDHVDRIATPRIEPSGPCRTHRATTRHPGQNRARRGRWTAQRAHRAVATGVRGHRPQVATPLVVGAGAGVAGRRAPLWSPPDIHRHAGRSGQGDGLHATRRRGVAAVAVVVPGARAPGHRRRRLRVDLAGHGPSVALRGRAQTLAAPVVDLHHRPGLRRQSPPRARPLRRKMGRKTVGGQRVRDLRRREDLHPGPLPLPPHAAARQGPRDARSTTTTTAAARSPTWPPTTSTAARCSAAARTPPASNRSPAWSPR